MKRASFVPSLDLHACVSRVDIRKGGGGGGGVYRKVLHNCFIEYPNTHRSCIETVNQVQGAYKMVGGSNV